MSDLWIPIAGLICFTIMVIANVVSSSMTKKEVQLTIRQLLDQGQNLTPELLEKLGTFKSQQTVDLRRGLTLVSVGLACILAGIVFSEIRTGFAIGVFPLLLGTAFFICWKVIQNEE
jgi:hypothetical protein